MQFAEGSHGLLAAPMDLVHTGKQACSQSCMPATVSCTVFGAAVFLAFHSTEVSYVSEKAPRGD